MGCRLIPSPGDAAGMQIETRDPQQPGLGDLELQTGREFFQAAGQTGDPRRQIALRL